MNLRTVYVISNKKPNNKQYKFMTSLLKTLHILFGLNLGFFAHKSLKFRLFVNIIMIIHCVVLSAFVILETNDIEFNFGSNWTILYFFEYLFTILFLSLFKRGTTFMNLQESLKEIDFKLRADFSRNYVELKVVIIIFFIYLTRISVIGFYCISVSEYCLNSFLDAYVFVFLTPCADISLYCYSFVFYSLYLRLAKLPPMLETNDNYDSIQRLYKEIVDTVEKHKRGFDKVYMLLLFCNVPQVMATIYFTLKEWQKQADRMTFLGVSLEYFYLLEVFALTIAPALSAEMLSTQAEEIKIILHDKMLLRGMHHKESLSRFIQYVEARPCRLRVWKLVPLSADLLGMVLSFCVTYLIVIVQFTNMQINN